MSRLYFLRKLRSFNVGSSRMLEIFYQSVVASAAIFFAAVCWGSSIRASDTNRLDKIIKKAGSVLGLRLESFETVVERRMLNRLLSIMDNDQHPLHHTVDRQQEYLLSQAALAPLSKGQIQEIFPATCHLTVDSSLRVGSELMPQAEEFKYLGVFFMGENKMESDIDRGIDVASAVMWALYLTVMVERELLIYKSIYVPVLTYGHELRALRSWIKAAKMIFTSG
ncbi:hypothetical protein L3Q82_003595 [Scortum barcoo]|uniref:Uncharacterized protein n=1 Tax=Scortum barcoo TaxID=214431 RepID=A0ACB8VMZ3_9TELE|nr:hypothetical protein L3Q82_003595 [Scortum barcoo]